MRFFRFWAPVIFWALLIFTLSSIPHLNSGLPCDFILRKSAHVTEYFILTLLMYRALKASIGLTGVYFSVFLVSLCLLYAVMDEIHQIFVPGRHGTARDVLIDALGIVSFFIVTKLVQRRAAALQSQPS